MKTQWVLIETLAGERIERATGTYRYLFGVLLDMQRAGCDVNIEPAGRTVYAETTAAQDGTYRGVDYSQQD